MPDFSVNGGLPREFQARVPNGPPTVYGFSAIAVILCSCGAKEPIQVHFIPGVSLTSHCKACGTKFDMVRIQLDKTVGPEMNVGIGFIPPAIVVPSTQQRM